MRQDQYVQKEPISKCFIGRTSGKGTAEIKQMMKKR